MESVFDFIFGMFDDVFSLFSSFEFYGITLLEYLFALLIIGVMLPIVVTLTRSTLYKSNYESIRDERRAFYRNLK